MVIGPAVNPQTYATSCDMILRLMLNNFPAVPEVSLPIVDVRDVAMAHILAIEKPTETNGFRFILA